MSSGNQDQRKEGRGSPAGLLHPNTTYTIDFSDAIVDNNEGNPLGNFAFTFSTGERIDTLEVSGTVLDASNLEPIKASSSGCMPTGGLCFVTRPFDRVARTDSRGRFTIRGIAPGTYHPTPSRTWTRTSSSLRKAR